MKHSEIMALEHTIHEDANGICRTTALDGFYITSWVDGDDVRQYFASKVMVNKIDKTDTKEYADVHIVTEEYHLQKETEKQVILDAEREQDEIEREQDLAELENNNLEDKND